MLQTTKHFLLFSLSQHNIIVLQKMIPNIIEQLSNKFVLVRFTLLMLNLLSCFLFLFSLFSLQHHFMAFDPFKVHLICNTLKGKTQGRNGAFNKIYRLYTVELINLLNSCTQGLEKWSPINFFPKTKRKERTKYRENEAQDFFGVSSTLIGSVYLETHI